MHPDESMRTTALALLAVCITVCVSGEPAHAEPKFWAAASAEDLDFSTMPTISVNLQKWRKKSTLVVDANVWMGGTSTSGTLYGIVFVNGLQALTPIVLTADCSGLCSAMGRMILDLDQGNVDHPGVFTTNGSAGLPLTIELQGWKTGLHHPNTGQMALTAEIKKKK